MFLLIALGASFFQGADINFNTSHVSINPPWLCLSRSVNDFNTSHVSINLACFLPFLLFGGNFNTSHVSINLKNEWLEQFYEEDFNTSHVSINLTALPSVMYWTLISIHLMFLLIASTTIQTSARPAFQYISCFY